MIIGKAADDFSEQCGLEFGGAVWLTEMDHLRVPFYQAYTDNTCTKARCAYLLLGNGDVLGLGQRHMLANDIIAALEQHECTCKAIRLVYGDQRYQASLTLTRGWGMGVERFLAWFSNIVT
jgi:beta-aspartyl-peptidase (threonine type)